MGDRILVNATRGPRRCKRTRFLVCLIGTGSANRRGFGTRSENTLSRWGAYRTRRHVDWDACEAILVDLSDKETCKAFTITKPTKSAVGAAIGATRQSGKSLPDLGVDLDAIAEKLIEIKPAPERKRVVCDGGIADKPTETCRSSRAFRFVLSPPPRRAVRLHVRHAG